MQLALSSYVDVRGGILAFNLYPIVAFTKQHKNVLASSMKGDIIVPVMPTYYYCSYVTYSSRPIWRFDRAVQV